MHNYFILDHWTKYYIEKLSFYKYYMSNNQTILMHFNIEGNLLFISNSISKEMRHFFYLQKKKYLLFLFYYFSTKYELNLDMYKTNYKSIFKNCEQIISHIDLAFEFKQKHEFYSHISTGLPKFELMS